MPENLFTKLTDKSPIEDIITIKIDAIISFREKYKSKSLTKQNNTTNTKHTNNEPKNPSNVLLGLIWLKKDLFPKLLPMKYADVSLNATNVIKNNNEDGDSLYKTYREQ